MFDVILFSFFITWFCWLVSGGFYCLSLDEGVVVKTKERLTLLSLAFFFWPIGVSLLPIWFLIFLLKTAFATESGKEEAETLEEE